MRLGSFNYIPLGKKTIHAVYNSCALLKRRPHALKGMHGKDSTGIDRADPMFGYPLESVEIGIADKTPLLTENLR